jgi:hypothetical protein
MSIDHEPRTHQSVTEPEIPRHKSLWERIPLSTKITAAVGTIGIAAAGFGATKVFGGHETDTPRSETTTSAPATIPTSEAPSASVTPTEAPSTTEAPASRYIPENPAQIAILDQLVEKGEAGVKEFESYPLKVRTSWFLSRLNVLAQGANGQVVYDTRTSDFTPLRFAGMDLAAYNPIKNETDGTGGAQYTRASTPEQVFGLGMLAQNMVGAYQQLNSDGRPAGFNKYYSAMLVTGRVAAANPSQSKEYKDHTDSALNSTKPSVLYQDTLDKYRVLKGTTLHPVKIGNETYEGMTITYQSEQGTGTVEKVFIPMSDELGFDEEGRPLGIWENVETTLPGEK